MLSARVNFFWHPGYVHCTAFSAVWILEWREAWPDVVNVFSQPWLSRYRQGYRLPGRCCSGIAGVAELSSSNDADLLLSA